MGLKYAARPGPAKFRAGPARFKAQFAGTARTAEPPGPCRVGFYSAGKITKNMNRNRLYVVFKKFIM